MISKFLSRYARQATETDLSSNESHDDDDSSDYVTKIEFIGTSTVEIKKFQTTSAYVLQQSQNSLQKIENSIDKLSEKTKGNLNDQLIINLC